jgi:four helix bundle protein
MQSGIRYELLVIESREDTMAVLFEELRVLKSAETIADSVWRHVVHWDVFAKDVVGKQLARAVDSIGANIAESFGRFHYGERLQFLYFARGSLFESKYWLNRAKARELMAAAQAQAFAAELTALARELNAFAGHIKSLRQDPGKPHKTLREVAEEYQVNIPHDAPPDSLFTSDELNWLDSQ